MKILVTGSSGFVGSHLMSELSDRFQMVAVARSENVSSPAVDIRIVPGISGATDWSQILEDIDVVIHLAARVHVMKETAEDPIAEFRAVNVEGTRALAEQAATSGVRKFIFMSSIKVNGEETEGPPYSAVDTPAPLDPYGLSKWEAEQILHTISENTGMQVVILRSPVVYGPNVKGNIRRIAKLVSTRIPLPLGSVNNRRSMISIGNLIRWIERAIEEEKKVSQPILISDPRPVSTKMLASGIADGMGIRIRMIPVPVVAMEYVAKWLRKKSLAQRLFSDLEVIPDFEVFPGLRENLADPMTELHAFGQSLMVKTDT